MHRALIPIILIISLTSVKCLQLKNICEKDQKFKFDGLQVNTVYQHSGESTFSNLEDHMITYNYKFEDWYDCPINRSMCAYDVDLYNRHILTIYSDLFFKKPIEEFYNYRKYIRNIRASFIKTRDLIKNNPNFTTYTSNLQEIINKVSYGYEFISCLSQIKEGKLCETVLAKSELQSLIDKAFLPKYVVFIFRNKLIDYYYTRNLIRSTFTINNASLRYRSLKSYAVINYVLSIPMHNSNFDNTAVCLTLDNLPGFYQDMDS